MAADFSLNCRNHPERHGVALCVMCRLTVCTECTTRFEGVNYCSACVPRLGRQRPSSEGRSSAVLDASLAALAYLGVAFLLYAGAAALAP